MSEISGDFAHLVAPLAGELRAHCYRMLGSVHDADDALQDTLVRAWRGFDRFEGRGSLRAWLYTVATRVCLDAAAARSRRALPMDLGPAADHAVVDSAPLTDVAWLGPYPDGDGAGGDPALRYGRRDAVELAFVAALQHLPANQRAALLLFEVLGFSAAEIAAMLGTSVTSVNSALARARRLVATRIGDDGGGSDGDDAAREVARRLATALERGDLDGFVALLAEDVTWVMPPLPHWYRGRTAVAGFAAAVPLSERCPSWRHRIVRANARPAVAFYLGAHPSAQHDPWSITVVDVRGGLVHGLASFIGPATFAAFGLPATLPAGS